MKKALNMSLCMIALITFALWAPDASAFQFYSTATNDQGGCAQCHTGFRDNNNYMSLAEGVSWGTSLHNVHLNNTTIDSSCENCHGGAGTAGRTVNIGSSANAADGVNAIACTGCHVPEGLRAHHAANGVTLCAGCHPDDPAPQPENIAPPWYRSVTNDIIGLNLEPCNAIGEEQLAGLTIGLDNDGDNLYDLDDPDCDICTPTGTPETVCNGIDDDCDGQIDEDYQMDNTCGLGVCGPPNNTPSSCADGVETPCEPGPQSEATDVTCDGADGDCDGQIDEDYVSMDTTCGTGECASSGQTFCMGGAEGDTCEPGTPSPEVCDDPGMLDEDCDGLSNADDPDCQVCTPTGTPETVCNGIDDDCDGLIDEDYMPMDTTCGTGECASAGQTTCVNGTEGDTCTPGTPSAEICDELDNDCDGEVDEGGVCEPGVVDLDIARFRVSKSAKVDSEIKRIQLTVENPNGGGEDMRPATLVGVQNGVEVYNQTRMVFDLAGNGRSRFAFPPYTPEMAGEINWTVTLADEDPDVDIATATTRVR